MSFTNHKFKGIAPRQLFNSEIEREIKCYANKNNLIIPSAFCRQDYEFYSEQSPQFMGIRYVVIFLARPKTPDEILRSQIEFQIKQMEQ